MGGQQRGPLRGKVFLGCSPGFAHLELPWLLLFIYFGFGSPPGGAPWLLLALCSEITLQCSEDHVLSGL